MSKPKIFMKPCYRGPRFTNHTIPLEILQDLSVLAELIVELAKWRYKERFPERKRVPRGFSETISLQLSAVEAGSAVPVICIESKDNTLVPSLAEQLSLDARNMVVDVIRAAEQGRNVTGIFPEEFLINFDKFGRGLRDGECVEFYTDSPGPPARFDKAVRKTLTLASPRVQTVTEEVTVRGRVPKADQEKKIVDIHTKAGQRIPVCFSDQHRTTILEAFNLYHDGFSVEVRGIGSCDRQGKLKSIETIEQIELLPPNDVLTRLDELRELLPGWLDGKGKALPADGLDWLGRCFEDLYPEGLESPCFFPTPEGGVQAEWSLGDNEISLEIDFATRLGEWHILNVVTDGETQRQLRLDDAATWEWIGEQIASCLGGSHG